MAAVGFSLPPPPPPPETVCNTVTSCLASLKSVLYGPTLQLWPQTLVLAGYFDVRGEDEEWIRVACKKGDMIVLPEGIYHRFTLDSHDYIKVINSNEL